MFDLVTIGTAFHRLDRRRVAELTRGWLRPGGYLALLWARTPNLGNAAWQQALASIIVDWMERVGAGDRLPANFSDHITEWPDAAVLADAGFVSVERYEFEGTHDWSVEALIGLLYSTSLLSTAALGDHRRAFEVDLRARLLTVEPSGVFREETSFAYDLARRE